MKSIQKFTAAAGLTASALLASSAQAAFIDIGVDVVGGVHSVDMTVCNTGESTVDTCSGDAFSLAFSGTPGPQLGIGPLSLFADGILLQDNLDSFSFRAKSNGGIFDPFDYMTTNVGDILSLLWLVDGNGGELQAFASLNQPPLPPPLPPLPGLVLAGFEAGPIGAPTAPLLFMEGIFSVECPPPPFGDPQCVNVFAPFFVDFANDGPLRVPNTAETPVPATLALLGIGLLLLRRRA